MRGLIALIAFTAMIFSWWFWWSHLLAWLPAVILYFPMLRELQRRSPIMIVSTVGHDRISGMSPDAVSWLNKNGHALVMWGAANQTSNHIKTLLAFAFLALVITAFRHSWWWLLEFVPFCSIMISLHDGFRPISKDIIAENSVSGKDAFVQTEIAPLFREIVQSQLPPTS